MGDDSQGFFKHLAKKVDNLDRIAGTEHNRLTYKAVNSTGIKFLLAKMPVRGLQAARLQCSAHRVKWLLDTKVNIEGAYAWAHLG